MRALRLAIFMALAAGSANLPANAADTIQGQWYTKDKRAIVTIAPCGKLLCGKLTKFVKPSPGGIRTDVQNPDPDLRKRSLLGINILSGFTPDGAKWRGNIYDPESGKTYRSIVTRTKNGVLSVEGCVAMFCQSQSWTEVK